MFKTTERLRSGNSLVAQLKKTDLVSCCKPTQTYRKNQHSLNNNKSVVNSELTGTGLYDTIALTQKGMNNKDFKLKNIDNWEDERSAGTVIRYKKNIPLNLGNGKHNGSLFLGYNSVINSLKLSVALPKLLYGSSLYEVTPDDKDKVTDEIYKVTSSWIDFDLDKCKIFRLDNSCNLLMDESVKKYVYALNAKTSEKIGHKTKGHFEGETLRFISDAETYLLYDKVRHESTMKGREQDLEAYKFRGQNILRYELQYKTDEAIATKKRYGRALFYKDLFSDEVIDRTKKLRVYAMDDIIRNAKQKYLLDYSSITKDLETMKKGNRYALTDFAWYLILKSELLSIDDIQRVMNGAGYSRQAIYKHTKKIKSLDKTQTKQNHLIDELYEKVLLKAS